MKFCASGKFFKLIGKKVAVTDRVNFNLAFFSKNTLTQFFIKKHIIVSKLFKFEGCDGLTLHTQF